MHVLVVRRVLSAPLSIDHECLWISTDAGAATLSSVVLYLIRVKQSAAEFATHPAAFVIDKIDRVETKCSSLDSLSIHYT